jgi:hypothetical protein
MLEKNRDAAIPDPAVPEEGEQDSSRRYDPGSGANETVDGLDATIEELRQAAEGTPSGAGPGKIEKALRPRWSGSENLERRSHFFRPPSLVADEPAVSQQSTLHAGPGQRMFFRMRQFLQWFFRNRETGVITIAQTPNLALWIVIVGSTLTWARHPAGRLGVALVIFVKAAIFVWAIDELWRGVNPWRHSLGAAVLGYELAAML